MYYYYIYTYYIVLLLSTDPVNVIRSINVLLISAYLSISWAIFHICVKYLPCLWPHYKLQHASPCTVQPVQRPSTVYLLLSATVTVLQST